MGRLLAFATMIALSVACGKSKDPVPSTWDGPAGSENELLYISQKQNSDPKQKLTQEKVTLLKERVKDPKTDLSNKIWTAEILRKNSNAKNTEEIQVAPKNSDEVGTNKEDNDQEKIETIIEQEIVNTASVRNLTQREQMNVLFRTKVAGQVQKKIKPNLAELQRKAKANESLGLIGTAELQELIKMKSPDPKWSQTYVFCRKDRSFPCRMVIKTPNGQWMKDELGDIWSIPVLGYARRPFFQINGNTPSGVYKILGVMPHANKVPAYGRFRRLKMGFYKLKSDGSERALLRLPFESLSSDWWWEASIARDLGRDHFRIHGTGVENTFKGSNYYPFLPTHGCIRTIEGNYFGREILDQRAVLDKLMEANGLTPFSSNENRIRSILYVANVSEKKGPVTQQEIPALISGQSSNL